MEQPKIKVLVVDDSAIYRKIITACLEKMPGVSVVGTAPNGRLALIKAKSLQPDLITLDVEMPDIDGVQTLKELQKSGFNIPVIMISAHTKEGAAVTIEALELGAYHFVTKPDGMDLQKNIHYLTESFKDLIAQLPRQQLLQTLKRSASKPSLTSVKPTSTFASKPSVVASKSNTVCKTGVALPRNKSVLVIGVSTGGPNALAEIIPKLPSTLKVPVLIVQHMPAAFTSVLAESLDKKSPLSVVEAKHGELIQRGKVYIAPGGKQMRLKGSASAATIDITDDAPVKHCKPSVDYLFSTVADVFGSSTLAVILTGMGDDGTEGCRQLKNKNAFVFVQSGDTCVVNGMPKAAIDAGVVDTVLPLSEIAPALASVF